MRSAKRMPVIITAVLSILVLAVISGCASVKAPVYADGEYTGSSTAGMGGKLNVAVIITEGMISDVKVTAHNETPGIGTNAIDALPGKIVEAQSTEVDSVAGASMTSTAIKEAVGAALAEAEGK